MITEKEMIIIEQPIVGKIVFLRQDAVKYSNIDDSENKKKSRQFTGARKPLNFTRE